ncbi:MAG TPA: TPM domain-containing protein [Phycisphaerae bacterium]|nr:TPM domain-containing protein [Phycisphaerae bacterium]
MSRSASPRTILDEYERQQLAEAVAEAERHTSAEIKVVILRHSWGDIRSKAARVFGKLHLERTAARNAVLILVATADREFIIYGDVGIHRKVGQEFWDNVRDVMARSFAEGEFGQGLCDAVRLAGGMLERHFPRGAGDVNEVPDAVVELE